MQPNPTPILHVHYRKQLAVERLSTESHGFVQVREQSELGCITGPDAKGYKIAMLSSSLQVRLAPDLPWAECEETMENYLVSKCRDASYCAALTFAAPSAPEHPNIFSPICMKFYAHSRNDLSQVRTHFHTH